MTKLEDKFILDWAKKTKIIGIMGGECKICKNKNIFVLEFHHLGDKDFAIAKNLSKPLSEILKEVEKCEILCANCHSELHYINGRRSIKKNELIRAIGKEKCERCGYRGKNANSLCFHHDKGEKLFNISDFISSTHGACKYSLSDFEREVDKCSIICRNCHQTEHSGSSIILYEKFKNVISQRIISHKEKPRVNKEMIFELKKEGKGICEIARIMKLNKSTVHYVFHKKE